MTLEITQTAAALTLDTIEYVSMWRLAALSFYNLIAHVNMNQVVSMCELTGSSQGTF